MNLNIIFYSPQSMSLSILTTLQDYFKFSFRVSWIEEIRFQV